MYIMYTHTKNNPHCCRDLDQQDPSGLSHSYLARLNTSSRSCPLLITGILCINRLNITLKYKFWMFLF